ncbi:hypothetical protein [Sporosarcina sp. P17b]|uniref:hypothetical protein n=1 Tax=Sporosarcina sp. P17b TaxID=2048260 RepID=UPI0013041FF1|nr:hypothetical protein [Sporosarcina sp. P17b]
MTGELFFGVVKVRKGWIGSLLEFCLFIESSEGHALDSRRHVGIAYSHEPAGGGAAAVS